MVAPSVAQTAQGGNGAGPGLTLTLGAAPPANRILIFAINKEDQLEGVTWPAGFTEFAQINTADGLNQMSAAWKRTGASEGTSYQATWTNQPWRNGLLLDVQDCIPTGDPQDVTRSVNAPSGAATTVPCLGITTVTNDCLILAIGAWRNDRTTTPPTGMSEHVDQLTISAASVAQATAGATGSKTFTISGSEGSRSGILLALKPAGATTAYRDTSSRFRLAVRAFRDTAARFRLRVGAFRDAASRFRLFVRAFRDTATRFRLRAQAFSDATARFRLFVRAFSDTSTRFRLRVTAFRDVAARFQLQVANQAIRDVAGRFKLAIQSFRDGAARFRLSVLAVRDAAGRFRLRATAFRDAAARFSVQVANQSIRDVAARFRLRVAAFRDAAARFRLRVSAIRDVASRFRLQVGAFRDSFARFRVSVLGVRDAASRFHLQLDPTAIVPGTAALSDELVWDATLSERIEDVTLSDTQVGSAVLAEGV